MQKTYNQEEFNEYLSKKLKLPHTVIKWTCFWTERYREIFLDDNPENRETNIRQFLDSLERRKESYVVKYAKEAIQRYYLLTDGIGYTKGFCHYDRGKQ
jgi:hypothetical protein